MKFEIYQIDTFTDKLFSGNPACVVPLTSWLPDELLLQIAQENAVAETAFFIDTGSKIQIRWFTPEIEMDLCGHATLATAHAIKTILNDPRNHLIFNSNGGELPVHINKNTYTLDLPSRKPLPAQLPEVIQSALNIQPSKVLLSRDYLLIYDCESDIRSMKVNKSTLDRINIDPGGVIVSARGDKHDFVSRFFTPQASILEDPVTGSAHCSLIPYWSEVLGKNKMTAMQLSARSGELLCELKVDRVYISGNAKTYSIGRFERECNLNSVWL